MVLSPIYDAMIGPVTTPLLTVAVPADVDPWANHTVFLHVVGSWQELGCCNARGDVRIVQLPEGSSTSSSRSGHSSSRGGARGSTGGTRCGSIVDPVGSAAPQLLQLTRASHKDSPFGVPRDFDYVEVWQDVRLNPSSNLQVEAQVFRGFFPSIWVEITLQYIVKPLLDPGYLAAIETSLGRKGTAGGGLLMASGASRKKAGVVKP